MTRDTKQSCYTIAAQRLAGYLKKEWKKTGRKPFTFVDFYEDQYKQDHTNPSGHLNRYKFSMGKDRVRKVFFDMVAAGILSVNMSRKTYVYELKVPLSSLQNEVKKRLG